MHSVENSVKRSFSGSLTRRLIFVALVVLIVPLIIHTFFLYHEEILIEEKDARDSLKALGAQIVLRISSQLDSDWKILGSEGVFKSFQAMTMKTPQGVSGNFAYLNQKGNQLFVGKMLSTGASAVFSHPIDSLISIPNPPFPINVSFEKNLPADDLVVEQFKIPNTDLVLTLTTSWELIEDLQTSRWMFRVGTFLALVIFVGGGLIALLSRQFSRSLETLRGTMIRVTDGAVHSRFTPQKLGFEINAIGLALNHTLDALVQQEEIARKEGAEKERLAEELALGRKIQNDLLPRHLPEVKSLDVTVGYLAAKEVSGDFYDLFPIQGKMDQILVLVGDLAGKGIAACLHAIGLRSSLRALANSGLDLKEIAAEAEKLFLNDAGNSGLFATLWLGIISGKKMAYLSLGHPPALLKRDGEIIELTTGDASLGILETSSLKQKTITFHPKDELLLYTDGATEAIDLEGRLLGMNQFKEIYLQSENAQNVLDEIERFASGSLQHDDLTLLYIRYLV